MPVTGKAILDKVLNFRKHTVFRLGGMAFCGRIRCAGNQAGVALAGGRRRVAHHRECGGCGIRHCAAALSSRTWLRTFANVSAS